ncbi:hypothetical protein VSR83_41670, partial [Paraburkholderia unamae]
GPSGVASGRRGQPGNRKLDEGLALRALMIIRERYADFGPTLACEKLGECHGIRLAKETVRRWMRDAGLWIPRAQRPPKVYQPRARRACLGELIQIDGSDHRWFEEHRPLRADEDLDALLTWREARRVTKSLTVQYDRVMYLLDDTPQNRKLVHRYIEVWEYPDGRIELRADARVLPYREYDRLSEVDQGAVIEHKRLTHALQVAQALQAQRDGRRASGSPSRTNRGIEVRRAERVPGTKKSREFTQADMNAAIVAVTQRKTQTIQSGKPGKRSATVR